MTEPTDEDLMYARTLWNYHRLDDRLEPSDVIIGLGSHDISVAECAAQLWHDGLAPQIVFTGANAPTTVAQFPEGEAFHYRERAIDLGVPGSAIVVETRATNTAENVCFVRELLTKSDGICDRAIVVSRPYQQRRARATFRKLWPDLRSSFTAKPVEFEDYLSQIGNARKVLEMLVGDTQRIVLYARKGFAAQEPLGNEVALAFSRLALAGYTARLVA